SAEGLHSIYYRLPDPNIGQRERIEERIPSDLDSPVILHTPLGKLIYELVVQFGVIRIGWGNNQNVIVRCDQKGEAMDNWLFREIQLEKSDLNRLTQIYEQHGRIELNQANQACLRLMHALFGT